MSNPAENRKLRILEAIVREYLESAEPVGSGTLVAKYRLKVSPATVRNDMVELTERGLLEQPHTSAGRRPTEAGYRLYVQYFINERFSPVAEILEQTQRVVDSLIRQQEEYAVRGFAQRLAELTGETAVVSMDGNVYMNGVTNLFSKPEFRTQELMTDFSIMFDSINELVCKAQQNITDDVVIFIGKENPFCPRLSSVITGWDSGNGLIGIIGPTRMDYKRNVSIMRTVREALNR